VTRNQRALATAFDRLEDFCAVQRAEHGAITSQGVDLLQEAVGIDDSMRRVPVERLPKLGTEAASGSVLLGMLLASLADES